MSSPVSPRVPSTPESGSNAALALEERTHGDTGGRFTAVPMLDDRIGALLAHLATTYGQAAELLRELARVHDIRVAARTRQSDVDGNVNTTESIPEHLAAGPPRLLSVEDLAGLFQVNAKTVRRWREEGLLPSSVSVGGVVRWHPEIVDAWIRGGAG